MQCNVVEAILMKIDGHKMVEYASAIRALILLRMAGCGGCARVSVYCDAVDFIPVKLTTSKIVLNEIHTIQIQTCSAHRRARVYEMP